MNQRIRNCMAAAGLMLSAMGAGAANYSTILTGQQEEPPNTCLLYTSDAADE